eukprot:429311-Amorphochlora_amoeboformis.AAC.1
MSQIYHQECHTTVTIESFQKAWKYGPLRRDRNYDIAQHTPSSLLLLDAGGRSCSFLKAATT